ncbi:pyroglutamyl-peptidase I [Arthrobacter livingstonensis]|uniref:Pyroglutamyl-peptidase I n=1 Tax=Arthrobacter livingstonensis TaxID=670078 RepID=A0A2V5LAA4_9MICC|nr:pyroglutamyl-peptidase I [Arthrobacter livingstonensis]PYI68515.1 pyroglutamyl-peptidase I [Arthrobacter livingstonensis]
MILITGFEPFGGGTSNPSWSAARLATEALNDSGLPATAVELPVEFGAAGEALRLALAAGPYDLVLAVGQAGGRPKLSLERVAINVDDARIPDNAGNAPVDEPVAAGGPVGYFSTLPLKACLQALNRAGIPAEVSQTAGTYVCNHVFYALMHQLAAAPGVRAGFVHVPYAPRQVSDGRLPSMEVSLMAHGLEIIARTALSTAADIKLAAGATH